MKNIEILSLQNNLLWNEYLQKLPIEQQDIYFTPEYYSLYENYGDGRAQCFVYQDGERLALYPFLLNEVNSLGFKLDDKYFDIQGAYGYNGIISNDYSQEFIVSFYKAFNDYCLQNKIIAEFTRFHPLLENHLFSKDFLNLFEDRLTVSIDLRRNIETIQAVYSPSTKRAIKKAKKNNLNIKIYKNEFKLKDKFIQLYYETMTRVESNQYLFFNDNYFNDLFNKKNVVLFIVEYNQLPIASSLCLYSDFYFHYHLGASSKNYLLFRPNDLLFDEMIQYASANNFKFIHFGGGISNNENDGLYKFKKGFSIDLLNFYIGKKVHNQGIYDEVVSQWEKKYPDKVEKYKNMLLKYRY